jgi:DNA-binding protein HU-beta|nr:MAG TPA: DNA binding protein [Caudoviricetes sp.]
MTKQEVATSVAKKIDIDHRQAVKAVEAVMETIMDAVSGGDEVTLRGFGTFKTVVRRAKKARDISRRETIMLPESKKPVFKPCKDFVSRVRK